MTTKATARGDARERILLAAETLIARHGVDGVSVRAINAAAAADRPTPQQRIAILEGLQAELGLAPEAARGWERDVRRERRAWTPRRTKRA